MPVTITRVLDAAARQRAVQAALKEGQGIWTLAIITGANIDQVHHRAAAGDRVAVRVLIAHTAVFNRLPAGASHSNALPRCLRCGALFWQRYPPAAVIALSAAVDVPERLLVSAVCADCWAASDTVADQRRAILDGLCRCYGMAGVRVLPPIVAAGHA